MSRGWVKVLTITVVVLAVLFVAADRLAVHYADKEVAKMVEEKYGYKSGTDGYVDVSIEGFPFLTQAAGKNFGHVTVSAGKFVIDTTNGQSAHVAVDRLHLDLRDVSVTSLTSRSAEANQVTGTLRLSYEELSAALTSLAGQGSRLTLSQAPGSGGQRARMKVTGTTGGRSVTTVGTLLAQGDEITMSAPGVGVSDQEWRVVLPAGTGFSGATAGPDGVELGIVGHQVRLGSSL